MCKDLTIKTLFVCYVFASFFMSGIAFAEQGNTSGSINLKDKPLQSEIYKKSIEEITEFLNFAAKSASQGGLSEKQKPLSKDAIELLTSLYLLCTVETGPCFPILESLKEYELNGARFHGRAKCELLPKFWHYWITNKMEERLGHKSTIAFFSEYSDFLQFERVSYVNCTKEVAELSKSEQLLRERYERHKDSILKATKLVEQLLKKYPSPKVAAQ
jgi:hypothetical protein